MGSDMAKEDSGATAHRNRRARSGTPRQLPSPFDAEPRYSVQTEDPFWHWIYVPIAKSAEVAARFVGRIQQGRISVYLTYSFLTLLVLLFFVR